VIHRSLCSFCTARLINIFKLKILRKHQKNDIPSQRSLLIMLLATGVPIIFACCKDGGTQSFIESKCKC
ncbi:MAG: hypothetical protein SGJ02_12020, partial [bacterium]|nr:hypothetical protein [bacterium]